MLFSLDPENLLNLFFREKRNANAIALFRVVLSVIT